MENTSSLNQIFWKIYFNGLPSALVLLQSLSMLSLLNRLVVATIQVGRGEIMSTGLNIRGVTNPALDPDPELDFSSFWEFGNSYSGSGSKL